MGHYEAEWDISESVNLTEVQLRAVELTVQGLSDIQIAEMLSVNRKTLWRWKTFNDEYRQTLASARSQLHASAADRSQNLLFRATAVLAKFLEDASDKNRLRAAQILLQTAGRFRPLARQQAAPTPVSDWPPPELEPKLG
jgi:hypothetical protein